MLDSVRISKPITGDDDATQISFFALYAFVT